MLGERLHPSGAGVKGAKPRQRIRELPAAEIEEASRVYLKERNQAMRIRRMREEMRLAVEREQLISKDLAGKQLVYLMIEMRQKLLALPAKLGNRFRSRGDELAREIVGYAKEVVHETLTVLARLPESVEPGWLERLEEEKE
jgi:hypothetical protein